MSVWSYFNFIFVHFVFYYLSLPIKYVYLNSADFFQTIIIVKYFDMNGLVPNIMVLML